MSGTGTPDLTLYVESSWSSPWVFHAMVALEEKQLAYAIESVSLPLSEATRTRLAARALVADLPILVHADTWIADAHAISEYLAEQFHAPSSTPLLPARPADRARARQLMNYLRDHLAALCEARPLSVVFGRTIALAMSGRARDEAAELERIALALLPDDRANLFGEWSIADCDLAVALMRLIASGDAIERRLVHYATAQLDRRSVHRFVAHLPTTR